METLGLKNVNMLSKEQYNTVAEPATDELWAVETETYSDADGNWYRVYPDGWCEQGGSFGASYSGYADKTFTFLKPFRDTQYFTMAQNSSTGDAYCTVLKDKTTTSATFARAVNISGLGCWIAKGYIA